MAHLGKGQTAEWKWGKYRAEGKITDKFTHDVTRKIKGTDVTRHASPDEPAYLLKQKGGGKVLKSESELKEKS